MEEAATEVAEKEQAPAVGATEVAGARPTLAKRGTSNYELQLEAQRLQREAAERERRWVRETERREKQLRAQRSAQAAAAGQ